MKGAPQGADAGVSIVLVAVTEAERLHDALRQTTERLLRILGGRVEQRDGYDLLVCRQLPFPVFNGVWVEAGIAPGALEQALAEIMAEDLPAGVQVRVGRTPDVARQARRLGLVPREPVHGMVATPSELRSAGTSDVRVTRARTRTDLSNALAVVAAGFEAPRARFAPTYLPEVAELDGLRFYLALTEGAFVSTAIGYTLGDTVGIFNVATPLRHRQHGYGTAVTRAAVADGFDAGATLAWLQAPTPSRPLYARLGFRAVSTYMTYAPE